MKQAFIGIDVGSTGCKAIAIDGEGRTVATASQRYDNTIVYLGLGQYDQDPAILRDASLRCCRALLEKLSADYHVSALGLTGQMHGLVALDAELQPLRPIMSCVDFRNEAQNDRIYAEVGGKTGLLDYTNNKMVPSCTGGKILWMMEHEPELFARTRVIVNPKDYVRTVLTGVPATDESDASGFGLYDVKNRCWSGELLVRIGIPARVLPKVLRSYEVVGPVLPEIAAQTGLPEDALVVAGAGDAIMQTCGSGTMEDGIYGVILGSGGNLSTVLDHCPRNEGALLQLYAGICENQWVAYAGLMSVGTSVNWFRKNYYAAESAAGSADAFAVMEREAAAVPAGSDGLVFVPSLMGQRNPVDDPFAKGVAIGFAPIHTRGHLYRALLEGLAMGMREVYELLETVGKPVRELHISGGGAASDTWCQIFSDVFQKPVCRMQEYSAAGAYGAALLAANCGRGASELKARMSHPPMERVFEPDAAKKNVYDDLYAIFKQVYPATKPLFPPLKNFEETYVTANGGV